MELTKEADSSKTEWGAIRVGEQVFARWKFDKNYYPGVIKERHVNDAWRIEFDDGSEGVASASHILPIRAFGVGIKVKYYPDDDNELVMLHGKDAKISGRTL